MVPGQTPIPELLTAVVEIYRVVAMVGKVKLSMPGLIKLKTAERRGKDKGKGGGYIMGWSSGSSTEFEAPRLDTNKMSCGREWRTAGLPV